MVLKISVLAGNTVTRWLLSKSTVFWATACSISFAVAAAQYCISAWQNRGGSQKQIRFDKITAHEWSCAVLETIIQSTRITPTYQNTLLYIELLYELQYMLFHHLYSSQLHFWLLVPLEKLNRKCT